MQKIYYAACDMDLKFAVDNGYRVGAAGTNVKYDPGLLQRRIDTVRRHEQFFNAFRACFGEYKPAMNGLDHMTSHLQGG